MWQVTPTVKHTLIFKYEGLRTYYFWLHYYAASCPGNLISWWSNRAAWRKLGPPSERKAHKGDECRQWQISATQWAQGMWVVLASTSCLEQGSRTAAWSRHEAWMLRLQRLSAVVGGIQLDDQTRMDPVRPNQRLSRQISNQLRREKIVLAEH